MASEQRPRRYARKLTRREIDLFLKALSRTGNLTLAAEHVGRHRSTFVKRSGRDPAFAARCGAAVAEFRLSAPGSGRGSSASPFGAGTGPLKCGRGDLLLVHGRTRPAQLRRAGGGELTQAGIDSFLQALAATANVRLSAASVGVWPNAIRNRRRRDAAFDRAVRQALQIGYERVEAALVESACRALEPDEEHEDWLEQNGGALLPKMDVDQAIMLLAQHRRTCRDGWATKRKQHARATTAEVADALERRLRQLGWKKEE